MSSAFGVLSDDEMRALLEMHVRQFVKDIEDGGIFQARDFRGNAFREGRHPGELMLDRLARIRAVVDEITKRQLEFSKLGYP